MRLTDTFMPSLVSSVYNTRNRTKFTTNLRSQNSSPKSSVITKRKSPIRLFSTAQSPKRPRVLLRGETDAAKGMIPEAAEKVESSALATKAMIEVLHVPIVDMIRLSE